MCYEFSGWYKKARTPEQVRNDVKVEKTATREVPAAPPKPTEPVTHVTEKEKIPA